MCASSGIPTFFSFSLVLFVSAVYMATTKDEEKYYYILSIIWLVDFFFASSFSLSALHRYSLSFFSSSPDPVRRQATEKRKRPSNRSKEVSYFLLASDGVFFCSPAETNTQYILLSLLLPFSLSLFPSLYLFLFVNLHLDIHAHTYTQSKTTLNWMYC